MRAAARSGTLGRIDRRGCAAVPPTTGNQERGNGKGRCHPLR
ncbi:hypothetical protein L810_6475 [Burkholderia sp. AU4i]|nr:hypothetical protein L810_6475 [Burkholderia sp. AU4i]